MWRKWIGKTTVKAGELTERLFGRRKKDKPKNSVLRQDETRRGVGSETKPKG